jgi:cytochrome c oxidase assembly protein subunit 15
MATHFGISLICLASAALLARVITQGEQKRDSGNISTAFRVFAASTVVVSVLVAYAGAYVRHTESELACTSWPTCTGEIIPTFEGAQGIHTMHRLAAGVISLMILGLLVWTWKMREERPDLFNLSVIAMIVVLAQSIVGREVIFSGLALMATLSHAGLMAILFVVLCETTRSVWPARVRRQSDSRQPAMVTPAPGD